MPEATITTDGSTPAISAATLSGAGQLIVQNNSDVPFYWRSNAQAGVSGATAGLILKPDGGTAVLPLPAAGRAFYCRHNAGSGMSKTLTYEILLA